MNGEATKIAASILSEAKDLRVFGVVMRLAIAKRTLEGTMKGKDGIDGINQTAINTTSQPRTKKAEKDPADKTSLGEILGRRGNDSEKIQLSLGRAIKDELGLEKFHAERRSRVEELKTLIKEGKYNPPTEKVAESVGRELVMEILTAPPTKEDENL